VNHDGSGITTLVARFRPVDLIQTPIEGRPIEVPTISLPQGGRELAGWWHRAVGFILDGIIVAVPTFILGKVLNNTTTERVTVNLVLTFAGIAYAAILLQTQGKTLGMRALSLQAISARTGSELTVGRAWSRSLVAFALYGLVTEVAFLYEASQPPGWITHHHEVTGLLLASYLFLLTFLWPIWDSRNQTLQDKAVGSVVIRTA
jgi:uncharacterized RDD family membrane protein YckC